MFEQKNFVYLHIAIPMPNESANDRVLSVEAWLCRAAAAQPQYLIVGNDEKLFTFAHCCAGLTVCK